MEIRRELGLINKQFDWFYRTQGMAILWYEFVPLSAGGSTYDDVYDEGIAGTSGKKYKSGVVLPVLRITESEDQKRSIPEARMPYQNVDLFVPAKAMSAAGITTPWEYETRLNDMFKWDGRFYTVVDYRVRGQLRSDVYYLITGSQVYVDQEMVNDPGPTDTVSVEHPWPAGLPNLG